MQKLSILFAIVGFSIFFVENISAQKKDNSFLKQLSFYHENDALFFPKNLDDNYTAGLRLDAVTREIKMWQPFFKLKGDNPKYYNHINVGFQSFTPRNIAAREIQTDDRPYASYVFLSLGKTQILKNKVFYSELSIGVLGSSIAEKLQIFVHERDFTQRPIPKGWDNQIEDGGSLAVNYKLNYLYVFNNLVSDNILIPSLRLESNIGNFNTDVYVGAQISLFNINYKNLSLNYNGRVGFNDLRENKSRFNVFIEPGLRLNIYNATLEGALFSNDSVYTIDRKNTNKFLFDMNVGVNWIIKDCLVLKYTLTRRTQEFSKGKKSHWWGGIGIGVKI
ncbi:lipid A-modifier LpxR family protein [Wenyingzhuangia sp. IMCC45533]